MPDGAFDFDLEWRPAPAAGLQVQELGDECCVYELERAEIHRLSRLATRLWRCCDGATLVGAIVASFQATPEGATEGEVLDGLQGLLERGLLVPPPTTAGPLSRRDLLTRVGVGVAAGVGLFLVETVAAPLPVQAASCLGSGMPCTTSSQCCSGVCMPGIGECV